MPQFDIFDANVVVDNVALPEYDVATDTQTKTVTCWIPSEAGKAFSVRWNQPSPLSQTTTGGYVSLDGTSIGGKFMRENQVGVLEVADVRVSQTTRRTLVFSTLELTDDDDYLHSSNAKDLGDIRLAIWKVSLGEVAFVPRPVSNSEEKVHEKIKKGMGHRVMFGEEKNAIRTPFYNAKPIDRLATFIFKYRSIDILRADGVAPPDPCSQTSRAEKRKADTVDNEEDQGEDDEEDDDGMEERAEAELKVLLERANQIQSLLAKKANRSKPKTRKKVKTEDRSTLISGEVIDLT